MSAALGFTGWICAPSQQPMLIGGHHESVVGTMLKPWCQARNISNTCHTYEIDRGTMQGGQGGVTGRAAAHSFPSPRSGDRRRPHSFPGPCANNARGRDDVSGDASRLEDWRSALRPSLAHVHAIPIGRDNGHTIGIQSGATTDISP